jgi:hypothetical protein
VNYVVPKAEVLPAAIRVARQIVQNSPDAVQSTKRGLILSQKHNFEEAVLTHNWAPETTQTYKGLNIKARLDLTSVRKLLPIMFFLGRIRGVCTGAGDVD